MQLYNSHIHTDASPDCEESIQDICSAAYSAGLSGITITDHFSGSLYLTYNSYNVLKTSTANARLMAKEYEGKLTVLAGAELDEMLWSPEYVKRVISTFDFDVVLASVHRVREAKDSNYLSRIDFSAFTEPELSEFAKAYFNEVLSIAKSCDFDVLSHLTLLIRYVCGKYQRNLSLAPYNNIIDEILNTLISRDKALEVNTSEVYNIGLMPNAEILARYYQLGGRKVTIGTDAHLKENLLKGFDIAVNTLQSIGFDGYCYYRNRQAVKIEFDKKI